MTQQMPQDRRRHQRYPLATGMQFHHVPTGKDHPARCIDVSEGGMLLFVPARTPIRVGQCVRLELPAAFHATPPVEAGPREATIVRVDRQRLVTEGQLAVGVHFNPPAGS